MAVTFEITDSGNTFTVVQKIDGVAKSQDGYPKKGTLLNIANGDVHFKFTQGKSFRAIPVGQIALPIYTDIPDLYSKLNNLIF